MIAQLFCKHKYKTHFKELKEIKTYKRINNTFEATQIVDEFFVEILICEKCGKIKKLKY